MDSMEEGDFIIDISSDEENLADSSVEISEEWLNELLESVDAEQPEDLELSATSFMKKQSSLQKVSDEDCVILDGDPDEVESLVDGGSEAVDGCAELLIVGEKGHLACRDYPHPRHLCISFPFTSTPHEKHCKLCHCYVCDSLAPCIYWGCGLSTADHCHASEKEQDWKWLRNFFKLLHTEVCDPLRGSQESCHPLPGTTTRFTAAIAPDLSIEREHQPLSSSLSGSRRLPVNRGTRHLIGSQSFPRSHASLRMSPFSNYDRLDSNQPHRSSVRTLMASPLASRQLIQPEATNNIELIQCMLASIEADLLGTDHNSGSNEESNIQSSSTLYPALSKPSVI